MTETVHVSEADLDAYVDGQIDPAGRVRVEAFLSKNPEAATRVMTDLTVRSTLRLSKSMDDAGCEARTRHAARRLETGLSDARMWATFQKIAAVALLVSVGWFANTSLGTREVNASAHPPAFVEQAVRAHKTSLVRAGMQSQPEVKAYDRDEIRAATAIAMPELPEDWQVIDVQVFPSEFGPSVEAAVRTAEGTPISIFAGRPGSFSVEAVTSVHLSDAEAAWWQLGEVAYAVVSSTPEIGLTDEAEVLKSSLY